MGRARQLGIVLAVVGVWALVAPYLGPSLGFVVQTLARTEFVTHVVPGVPVLGVAAYLAATGRLPLPLALVTVLCGFWMTGTHLPLLVQAYDGGVDWPSALWHSIPGLVIFVIGAAAATYGWLDERDRERGPQASRR